MDKAICNTILFLISSPKLKRNTLAENLNLDDLIKFVLAYEQFRHTAALLKPCAVSPDPDESVAAHGGILSIMISHNSCVTIII